MSIQLPQGSIESHRITVVSYITEDGGAAYVVDTNGEVPMTSFLGLLVVAQQEILHWNEEND